MRWSLPVAPFGNLLENDDPARHLERGKASGAEIAQLAFRRNQSIAQYHCCGDFFAELAVRHRKSHRLSHGRMVHQHLIDLEWRDLLTTAIDQFLEPIRKTQITLVIDDALVAGAEPSSVKAAALAAGFAS